VKENVHFRYIKYEYELQARNALTNKVDNELNTNKAVSNYIDYDFQFKSAKYKMI
jgi:hypothetical protein